jgi:hypothetical protein
MVNEGYAGRTGHSLGSAAYRIASAWFRPPACHPAEPGNDSAGPRIAPVRLRTEILLLLNDGKLKSICYR